jgi:hypothetical protein
MFTHPYSNKKRFVYYVSYLIILSNFKQAWQLFEEERWIELIDAALPPNDHSVEIMRVINIALLCVQEDAIDRPTTLDVVAMLSSKTMILDKPKQPAYFSASVGNKEEPTATRSCSVNDVTITMIAPR